MMTATTNHGDGRLPIPVRLKRLSRSDWETYRDTSARYEAAWSSAAHPPAIDDFLPSPGHQPLRSLLLIHLIQEEYERRRGQGEAVAMARYFDRFPELHDDPSAIQELGSWEAQLTVSSQRDEPTAPPPALPEGYRFLRELPGGGMSRLFLVENPDGGREVLKQVDPEREGNAVDLRRFETEIDLARRLAAKGIGVVPVALVGQVDGRLAYTMPYCEGGSLRDRLRARGGKPLPPRDAARLVVALARTVQSLQDEQPPIVHRDLKPENVLFPAETSDWNQPLLADLGLAKVLGREGPTRTGAVMGTWVYMAPEQVRDPARVDGRADVYSLGVILYECLTRRRPFSGETPLEIIHRIYHETPVDPSKRVEGVPAALDKVVQKCLEKEPLHRYATARELGDDLERFLEGESVQARPPGRLARLRSWAGRYPKEALAYATALGALVVGLVASTWWAVVAAENAQRAQTQAENAQREARRANDEARRANDNAGLINGGLGQLVRRVGEDRKLQAAGLTAFRSELLHDAVGMYDDLVRRNPGEGTLGLGEALNNQTLLLFLLGSIPQALESARRAEAVLAALRPSYESLRALANARKQLGVVDNAVGEPAEGLKNTREAVTIYQALLREKPGDQDVRFQLALATVNLGNFAMGQDAEVAIARYREALELLAPLRREAPSNPRYAEWEARTKSNLGLILAETKKIQAAIEAQREAVTVAGQVSDEFLRLDALATCRNNLGEALELGRRFPESELVFRQSLNDYKSLASRFPNDIDYRWGVAMALTNVAAVAVEQGRHEEAAGLLEESRKLFDDLSPRLGKNSNFQEHLAKNVRVREVVRQHLNANHP
jgi:tetratricopeptide (TPR) repeat protein